MISKTGFTNFSSGVYQPINRPSVMPSTTASRNPTEATLTLDRMFAPSVEPSGLGSDSFCTNVSRICVGEGKYLVETNPVSTMNAHTAMKRTTVSTEAIKKRYLCKNFSFFIV